MGLFELLLVKAWAIFCALVGSIVAAVLLKPGSRLQATYLVMGNFMLSVVVAPAFIAWALPSLPAGDARTGAIYCGFGMVGMVVAPMFITACRGAADKLFNGWLARLWKND